MRLHCDIEGLEDNWIDISEQWTRREFREMLDANGDELLAILHAKATACHIEAGDTVITDVADLTEDALDDIDLRLVGFIGGILVHAGVRLRELGNVSARPSSPGTGPQPTKD
jgi:hypothetical protein